LIAFCAIVLGLFVAVWARGRIAMFLQRAKHRVGDARKRWLESDAVALRKLCAVARQGEWRRTIPALYRWMDRSGDFGHPARLENLPRADDPKVAELADAVTVYFANGVAREFRWKDTESALRRVWKKKKLQQQERAPLPPLNEY
jgi:hypothetical protein